MKYKNKKWILIKKKVLFYKKIIKNISNTNDLFHIKIKNEY